MESTLIRNNIILALSNIFIFIDNDENEDVDLEAYIDDSIQFISLIVELEKIFNVEFPPESLIFDNFKTINRISLIIEELISLNNN